jgi:hypothetical protein
MHVFIVGRFAYNNQLQINLANYKTGINHAVLESGVELSVSFIHIIY